MKRILLQKFVDPRYAMPRTASRQGVKRACVVEQIFKLSAVGFVVSRYIHNHMKMIDCFGIVAPDQP